MKIVKASRARTKGQRFSAAPRILVHELRSKSYGDLPDITFLYKHSRLNIKTKTRAMHHERTRQVVYLVSTVCRGIAVAVYLNAH
jgi:hypothetical protein